MNYGCLLWVFWRNFTILYGDCIVLCLLMAWLLTSPGHQQPCFSGACYGGGSQDWAKIKGTSIWSNPSKLWRSCEKWSICYFSGLMQERRNSIANALELRLSHTNPSISCRHFNYGQSIIIMIIIIKCQCPSLVCCIIITFNHILHVSNLLWPCDAIWGHSATSHYTLHRQAITPLSERILTCYQQGPKTIWR